ncbi:hypothetical protein M408DRAFT_24618 [Serendipita vermifera MAFF 305830]|uniref:Uncharacterized protein n=1 Tax=Serendipita vermifera MAFF 305830 TaxID=933852 RepID=A0A0C3AS55_SERVB|nr:hypothetical protein M408DRAFT_24618 [Serendipita vermifera MAFF 305830]
MSTGVSSSYSFSVVSLGIAKNTSSVSIKCDASVTSVIFSGISLAASTAVAIGRSNVISVSIGSAVNDVIDDAVANAVDGLAANHAGDDAITNAVDALNTLLIVAPGNNWLGCSETVGEDHGYFLRLWADRIDLESDGQDQSNHAKAKASRFHVAYQVTLREDAHNKQREN